MAGDLLDSKRRAIIFFIFALLFAAIAGFMFLQKLQELNTGLGEMSEVYVANRDISPRSIITEDSIGTQELPKKYVTDSHITNPEEIIGKMSRISLSKGDLVTTKMVKDLDLEPVGNNRLVRVLQGGNVQFEAYDLEYQDRIDLIVTREVSGELQTELFMEDVLVAGKDGFGKDFRGVYVEVSMEEAISLIDTQLTAHHIRVLNANAGIYNIPEEQAKEEEEDEEQKEEEPVEETVKEQPVEEQETDQDTQTEDGTTNE